jgi:hypothetical protein
MECAFRLFGCWHSLKSCAFINSYYNCVSPLDLLSLTNQASEDELNRHREMINTSISRFQRLIIASTAILL